MPGGWALPNWRWTGYDFPVLTIDTWYLIRPNWLLAGYSVYHRVGFQPTIFMRGPRSRHQRRCVRDATYFFYECMMIHSRIESPSVQRTLNQHSIVKLTPSLSLSQGMHMNVFSKVYCDRVYFFCAPSGLRQGQVVTPSGTPYPVERWVPPPPPPTGRKWAKSETSFLKECIITEKLKTAICHQRNREPPKGWVHIRLWSK